MFIFRPLAVLCLALGLAACALEAPLMQTGTPQDVTASALGPLNALRAKSGLGPVVADPALVGVASRQVQAMAAHDVLSHEVGGDFTTRVNAAGFVHAAVAENVGAGHPTVESAINAWLASPHHRENMLLKNASGVAVVRIDAPQSHYQSYWALEIATGQAKPGFQASFMPMLPGLLNN